MEMRPETVAATAKRLGVTSPIGHDPAIALGSSEVNLLELTAAYAAAVKGQGPVKPFGVAADRPRELLWVAPAAPGALGADDATLVATPRALDAPEVTALLAPGDRWLGLQRLRD